MFNLDFSLWLSVVFSFDFSVWLLSIVFSFDFSFQLSVVLISCQEMFPLWVLLFVLIPNDYKCITFLSFLMFAVQFKCSNLFWKGGGGWGLNW